MRRAAARRRGDILFDRWPVERFGEARSREQKLDDEKKGDAGQCRDANKPHHAKCL